MALDLWDTGVKVKLILPGPVDTEIWDHPDAEPSSYTGEKVPAIDVATGIADAIGADAFEHYLPDMRAVVEYKTARIDDFLARTVEALR